MGDAAYGVCYTCGLRKPLSDFPTISTIAGPVDELEVCPDCYDPDDKSQPSYVGFVEIEANPRKVGDENGR